jgi:hypothetical protein
MFRFFTKESVRPKAESIKTVSVSEALESPSVWNNDSLKAELRAYEALMTYMSIDRAAADPLVEKGILANISRILAQDCGIAFANETDLESFVHDVLLLQSSPK